MNTSHLEIQHPQAAVVLRMLPYDRSWAGVITDTRARPERGVPVLLISVLCLLGIVFCPLALGQQYSIDWEKVAGGGGTSTGGVYTVSGTIGQADAGAMSGGDYLVTGGFWSLIAAVPTPGAPALAIAHWGNSVIVSWPYPSTGFVLQQKSDLSDPAGWSNYAGSVSTNNGVNRMTITPLAGDLFFRLYHP